MYFLAVAHCFRIYISYVSQEGGKLFVRVKFHVDTNCNPLPIRIFIHREITIIHGIGVEAFFLDKS